MNKEKMVASYVLGTYNRFEYERWMKIIKDYPVAFEEHAHVDIHGRVFRSVVIPEINVVFVYEIKARIKDSEKPVVLQKFHDCRFTRRYSVNAERGPAIDE